MRHGKGCDCDDCFMHKEFRRLKEQPWFRALPDDGDATENEQWLQVAIVDSAQADHPFSDEEIARRVTAEVVPHADE